MKSKNLIIIGGIGVVLYYLLKKENKSQDLTGSIPTPPKQSFTKEELSGANRNITLTEDVGMLKRMGATITYVKRSTGGARPSQYMERTSGKWIVNGDLPNLKTTEACPIQIVYDKKGCSRVATTKDVIDFIFNKSDIVWKAKFGEIIKKDKGFGKLGLGFPKNAFPSGMDKYKTYAVPSGISN
tara:strand:- start:33 stop:584 length:552 start_codon:yes stop_codon:yes gene_type:complete